jgi:hypothetical protein
MLPGPQHGRPPSPRWRELLQCPPDGIQQQFGRFYKCQKHQQSRLIFGPSTRNQVQQGGA